MAKKVTDTKKKLVEKFEDIKEIYGIIHTVFSVIAIYASIRCNNGFSFGAFMIALCCPYFYLIYIAATKGLTFCAGDITKPIGN